MDYPHLDDKDIAEKFPKQHAVIHARMQKEGIDHWYNVSGCFSTLKGKDYLEVGYANPAIDDESLGVCMDCTDGQTLILEWDISSD